MSLLLLFNGIFDAPSPVPIQVFPMGDHGVAAIVEFGGRVSIVDADGLIAIGGDGIQDRIVDNGVAATAGGTAISIRTGID